MAQLKTSDDLLICTACGTQFPVTASSNKKECRICDDPRQFVPPSGQSFTTLAQMRKDGFKNVWRQDEQNPKIWSVWTEQKVRPAVNNATFISNNRFAIGERAMLLQTPHGNVLWDLITLLDQETVDKIESLGSLSAIVISHPHYYTTYADWSRTFNGCPVYVARVDSIWLEHFPDANLQLMTDQHVPIVPGVTSIRCGGHFEGSLCLQWDDNGGHLFIADTMLTVPSGLNPFPGKPGVTSYSFMYSIPNWIPMSPDAILGIWDALKRYEFHSTHGAFGHMDVRERDGDGGGSVKGRVLESMKIAVRGMGYQDHKIFGLSI